MTRAKALIIAGVIGVAAALIISSIDFGEVVREAGLLPLRHDDIIRQQAEEKDLDPALIAAVINAESSFSNGQTSEAGARGLMQVTPNTAQDIADQTGGTAFVVDDLDDPQINISYGSRHLRDLLDQYEGNLIAALAGYNGGSGNVDKWGGSQLLMEDIEFAETRAFVEQVLEERDQYRENYAEDLGLEPVPGQ